MSGRMEGIFSPPVVLPSASGIQLTARIGLIKVTKSRLHNYFYEYFLFVCHHFEGIFYTL